MCPFCNSPARWVALLAQGGADRKTITKTLEHFLARVSAVLRDGASLGDAKSGLRMRSATQRSHTDYVRAWRAANNLLGLCSYCHRRARRPGYSQCRQCQEARARKKRMARRIGSKRCPCGQPAVNIRCGEYICAECMRKEG